MRKLGNTNDWRIAIAAPLVLLAGGCATTANHDTPSSLSRLPAAGVGDVASADLPSQTVQPVALGAPRDGYYSVEELAAWRAAAADIRAGQTRGSRFTSGSC